VRLAALCVLVLLAGQVLAGAVLVELRLVAVTRGIHLALASALWAATAVLAMLVRPGLLRSEEAGGDQLGTRVAAEGGVPTHPASPAPSVTGAPSAGSAGPAAQVPASGALR
jgi:heme A synthase